MEEQKQIRYFTLLLSITAGFCDTVTFVSANQMFSAHVTGNFIVFAYNIIKNEGVDAWLKLLSFPVFIIAVIVGGRLAGKEFNRYQLLTVEAVLLIICGTVAYLCPVLDISTSALTNFLLGLLVVFAMGLQNAFGKIFSKDTYGPTTMMTGNVTQAALDLGNLLKNGFSDLPARGNFAQQTVTIGGFLGGCVAGAVIGKYIGLTAVMLPGLVLIIFIFSCRTNKNTVL